MHYDVDYSVFDNEVDKHNAAIEDIRDYLGGEKFATLTTEFRAMGEMTFGSFANYVSIAGISGYPVKAWYNHIWPL